ncbi:MAG: purine-nucleoside phosphorylase [Candidatus Cloacimonadota bacterium]|nr:MAG: purine-nucleoside phosphorylase [Candidatus Cloacimonadota bacterium]PIE78234.1 MAG: purine-nucleoside phosphorylase [Candidatus Delongbacteria bacterium]
MVLVSSCLVGINCRYDGKNSKNEEFASMVESGEAVAVCPETAGGLSTPRKPCEIREGRVFNIEGEDLTENFVKGGNLTLELCKIFNIEKCYLKSNSPSCGCGTVYDGTFTGKKIEGNGITAEILLKNGIEVISV